MPDLLGGGIGAIGGYWAEGSSTGALHGAFLGMMVGGIGGGVLRRIRLSGRVSPAQVGDYISAAIGTGQSSRTLANPARGSFLRGLRVRWRAGRRYSSLYLSAQRLVVRGRTQQVQALKDQVGFRGRVRYLHESGSSIINQDSFNIVIRQHAFYEPGGVKSVFLHEVAHSELPRWATEFQVDMHAVRIAEDVYGHSDDIILPFVD